MLDLMYDIPGKKGVKEVVVSEEVIDKKDAPVMVYVEEAEPA